MKVRLTLSKKLTLLVAVPLVFELGFLVALGSILRQVDLERQQEAHARDVSAQLNILLRMLLDSIASGVMFQLNAEGSFTDKVRPVVPTLMSQIKVIQQLTKDNEHERDAAFAIEASCRETVTYWEAAKTSMQSGDTMGTVVVWGKLKGRMKKLSSRVDALIQEQEAIQRSKGKLESEYRKQVEQLLIAGAAINLLVAVLLVIQFNRQLARRLNLLSDNTIKLALGKDLNPKLSGNDELANLDAFFRKMAGTLNDLRKKEHAIVDNAVEVICSIDAKGSFADINPACQKAWGYTPEELLGRRILSIVSSESLEETLKEIDTIIKKNEDGMFETRIMRKDRSVADALFTAHWSKEDKVLFCVVHDISERKQIEIMKRDFMAMVSHDLKTPLTTIQLFHTALESGAYGEINERGSKNLQMIESEVDRLIGLVSDLLDIQRLESGRMSLALSSSSIDELLEHAIDASKSLADARKIHLEIDKGTQEGLSARLDEDRMTQVLLNLIGNAIKFSPDQSTISVKARLLTDEIEICVMDRGRGVPDQFKESIFDRFKQVEQSDAKDRRGSGLGLAICKAIVERHGGTVGVIDRPEGGSIFWLRLPINNDS